MADERFSRSDWLRLAATVAWLAVLVLRPQLTFAVTLLLVGGVMVAFNATIFWARAVREGDAPSVVPVFGGVLAAAGVALLPWEGSWQWAWVPLALDWGGCPLLLVALYRRLSG